MAIILLADMQLWPAFKILPLIQASTVLSISASSRIIYGSLPPNSKTVFFKYSPATFATDRPAGVLPVIVTAAIRGSFITFSVFLPETDTFEKYRLESLLF